MLALHWEHHCHGALPPPPSPARRRGLRLAASGTSSSIMLASGLVPQLQQQPLAHEACRVLTHAVKF